jgi:hypothetical protein
MYLWKASCAKPFGSQKEVLLSDETLSKPFRA